MSVPGVNDETTSRLWPVLLGLVLLVGGSVGVQSVGHLGAGAVRVIKVEAAGDVEGDQVDVVAGAALDDDHAKARDALRRGQSEAAATAYQALAERYPESPVIALEQGAALVDARRTLEGIPILERAKQLAPNEERIAVELARAYSKRKDHVRAEAELRRALTLRPGYGVAMRLLGKTLKAMGKKQEAIELLTQAAQFGGNEERATSLVALGDALLDDNRAEDARAAFDKAIERAPARVEVRLGIARAFLATGKKDDAARAASVLSIAAELAPDLPDVQTSIGQAREAAGDVEGAEEAYWQALRLSPQATFPRRRLLRLALDKQQFDRAQRHADELLAIDAEEPEHHFVAALVAARQGNAPLARDRYARAIAKANGDYPEAYLNLGGVEKDAGDLDAAIAAYRKALELRPGYHAAENNLALALVAAGRLDDAESLYREVLARSPSYTPAWLNLGKLYSQRKQFERAIEAYQKAIEIKPDYTKALIDLGVAYVRLGKLDDAIASYQKVIALNPKSVNAWHNLGLAQLQQGDKPKAEASLRQALVLDPDHAPSERKLAGLLAARGVADEARTLYQDLLDEDAHDVEARLGVAALALGAQDRAACARDVTFAAEDLKKRGPPKTPDDDALAAALQRLQAQCPPP